MTFFTVLEAKGAATYCAPNEHMLAALFVCPPGVPQILRCVKTRHYREIEPTLTDVADSGGHGPPS